MRARFSLALAAGMLSLTLFASAAAASPSPRTLLLHAADMPQGFAGSTPVAVTNAQAATRDHVALSAYNAHGRVISYDVSFARSSGRGLLGVENAVVQYRTPGGAHWDYRYWTASTRKGIAQNPGSTGTFSVPSSLGEEAFGFTSRQRSNGTTLHYWTVMFRRGNYWSMVMVIGNTSASYQSKAVGWAELIDARIRLVQ